MAGFARKSLGVLCRLDLRKALGRGGARRVASGTEHGRIRQNRLHGHWILGMVGQRSMASFAVHVRMFAAVLLFRYVGVAGLASFVAGKLDRTRRDFADGIPAVVPILPEAFGHLKSAYHQKGQKGKNEKSGKPEKMSCMLEDTH